MPYMSVVLFCTITKMRSGMHLAQVSYQSFWKGGAIMVDRTYAGTRCRTVRHINTRDGLLPRDTRGTIRYEMDNLDRRLVVVDWDNDMNALVFAEEIEILR
jgi:hypothetical protein